MVRNPQVQNSSVWGLEVPPATLQRSPTISSLPHRHIQSDSVATSRSEELVSFKLELVSEMSRASEIEALHSVLLE
jgi:hypothetical protein